MFLQDFFSSPGELLGTVKHLPKVRSSVFLIAYFFCCKAEYCGKKKGGKKCGWKYALSHRNGVCLSILDSIFCVAER